MMIMTVCECECGMNERFVLSAARNTWCGVVCACQVCDQRLFHPRWPADVKKLEKQWAMLQAAQREMDDIDDFLHG